MVKTFAGHTTPKGMPRRIIVRICAGARLGEEAVAFGAVRGANEKPGSARRCLRYSLRIS